MNRNSEQPRLDTRLATINPRIERQKVMQRAETWIQHVGASRPVENSIIRDLLMELAMLDGAYELLASHDRVHGRG